MTGFAGGGGGAIYKDGTPLNEQLGNGESVTVPAGETWVAEINLVGRANSSRAYVKINGNFAQVSGDESASLEANTTAEYVLSGGDTVKTNGDTSVLAASITGWVL
jgi:hypothetical protein